MRHSLGFLAATLAAAVSAHAQRGLVRPTDYEYLERNLPHKHAVPRLTGTTLRLPEWSVGTVVMRTGAVKKDQWLKYDLASEKLLWRRPQGDSVEVFMTLLKRFTLRDSAQHRTLVYELYPEVRTEEPLLRTVFFGVQYDSGRTALLSRERRRVHTTTGGGVLATSKSAQWVSETEYYLKLPNNRLVPVRLNRKSLITGLGETHRAQLEAYAAEHDLNLNTEDGAEKLLAFFDSIKPN